MSNINLSNEKEITNKKIIFKLTKNTEDLLYIDEKGVS